MNKTTKIVLLVLSVTCVTFFACVFVLRQLAAKSLPSAVQVARTSLINSLDHLEEALTPLTEVDVILRYNPTNQAFALWHKDSPDVSEITQEGLEGIHVTSDKPAKVLVRYREADMSDQSKRLEFEATVRTRLAKAGTTNVFFSIQVADKDSLFP